MRRVSEKYHRSRIELYSKILIVFGGFVCENFGLKIISLLTDVFNLINELDLTEKLVIIKKY